MQRREFLGAAIGGLAAAIFGKEYNERYSNEPRVSNDDSLNTGGITSKTVEPKRTVEFSSTETRHEHTEIREAIEYFLQTNDVGIPPVLSRPTPENTTGYINYTPEMDTQLHRKQGREYIGNLIANAHNAIAEAQITSRSGNRNVKVHQTIPPEIIATMLIVEHLGYRDLCNAPTAEQRSAVVNVPIVTFGINKELAYNNETSNRDARGIAQLRNIAYMDACGATAENYTCNNPLFSGNFDNDVQNHLTSIIAMYCLMDHNCTALPPEVRNRLICPPNGHNKQTMQELGEYMAVAYNAGVSTLRRLLNEHGEQWREHASGDYLERFKAVWEFFSIEKNV